MQPNFGNDKGRPITGYRFQSLIVAPTHAECRAIAARVRELQKSACLVSREEHQVVCLERLNLTESQRGDAINYRAGQVVEFTGALEEASRAARSGK